MFIKLKYSILIFALFHHSKKHLYSNYILELNQ